MELPGVRNNCDTLLFSRVTTEILYQQLSPGNGIIISNTIIPVLWCSLSGLAQTRPRNDSSEPHRDNIPASYLPTSSAHTRQHSSVIDQRFTGMVWCANLQWRVGQSLGASTTPDSGLWGKCVSASDLHDGTTAAHTTRNSYRDPKAD